MFFVSLFRSAHCCNLVYISDVACGLEFGFFPFFKKTGDVTTLIYAASSPFFLGLCI